MFKIMCRCAKPIIITVMGTRSCSKCKGQL